MTKGAAQFIPLLALVLVITSFFAISSSSKTNKTGSSTVLSESESGGGDRSGSSSGSSGSGDSNTSTSGSSGEIRTESSGTPKPTATGTTFRVRATEKPEIENEQEAELPELENENEFEVEEGTETARIRLGKRENRFVFFESRFGAETTLPVSVNKRTRELTIDTPAGIRTVAVLPDSAVNNMIASRVIDRIVGANGSIVQIKVDENGNIEYEIVGARDARFLGVLNVAIPKTLNVSAQTGGLVNVNESFFDRFIDALSI